MTPGEFGSERRGMRLWELVALAAGGVLGSGWMTAPGQIGGSLTQSLLTWAVGCLLMAGYAVVVVELGIADQRTGGLIFHPLRACGPLVATVVAGSMWVAYAINPAVQSLSVANTLSAVAGDRDGKSPLTEAATLGEVLPWLMLAAAIMAGVFLLTLLPSRQLLMVTVSLTGVKILVLVTVVAAIVARHADGFSGPSLGAFSLDGMFTALKAVVPGLISASVIFSYIGFQAPVDFAGDVQGNQRQVARTIRAAVYGTVAGSFVLYAAMQVAWSLLVQDKSETAGGGAPANFVEAVQGTRWLWVLVVVAAIIAPLGSAIVFSLALTREVAALCRAHLVGRGLQTARFSRIRSSGRYDVYWLITLVNLGVALLIAIFAIGIGIGAGSSSIRSLHGLNSVSLLLVYTMSGVVLAVRPGRRVKLLPGAIFVLTALIVVGTGIGGREDGGPWAASVSGHLVGGMIVMSLAALILLAAPWLAERDLPVAGRVLGGLDAQNHLSRLGAWFGDASVPPFVWLVAYLVLLGVCAGLGSIAESMAAVLLGLASCGSLMLFGLLLRSSRKYMDAPDHNS
ncbi:APC family permease [Actinomadura sp. 3N508]|uniref:APC family permease n=1 Tax=Actinomadura sp. 3N508 TaxID=3375153 RepID=UPI0037885A2E